MEVTRMLIKILQLHRLSLALIHTAGDFVIEYIITHLPFSGCFVGFSRLIIVSLRKLLSSCNFERMAFEKCNSSKNWD